MSANLVLSSRPRSSIRSRSTGMNFISLSAGCPGGGGMSMRAAWTPPSAIIFCASGEIMNWANSFAAFGLRAPLMIAVGEDTMKTPLLIGHLLPVGETARIGALRADHPFALLHRAEHLLVALHDHGLVGAQGLVEVPPERARQHAHHDQLDRGEGRIRHHHEALIFRVLEVGPGRGNILHLVAAD